MSNIDKLSNLYLKKTLLDVRIKHARKMLPTAENLAKADDIKADQQALLDEFMAFHDSLCAESEARYAEGKKNDKSQVWLARAFCGCLAASYAWLILAMFRGHF